MSSELIPSLGPAEAETPEPQSDYPGARFVLPGSSREAYVVQDGPVTCMELNTYDKVEITRGNWIIFIVGLLITIASVFTLPYTPVGVVPMLAAPIAAVLLERRLWRRGKTLRIYTDEVQVREGGELLGAYPWSEVEVFSEKSSRAIAGHEVLLKMSDGAEWLVQMRSPALQVLRSGIRLLGPGHCRVLVGHRQMLQYPMAVMRWSAGLTVLLLAILFIPALAPIAPLALLVFATIPTFLFGLAEWRNKNESRDWDLQQSARSATDLLRVLPIMDNEYHAFRHGNRRLLAAKREKARRSIWAARITLLGLGIGMVAAAFLMAGSPAAMVTPFVLASLAALWGFAEHLRREAEENAKVVEERLIIRDQKLYLLRDGEERECQLKRRSNSIDYSEVMELICGKEKFRLLPSEMLEEEWVDNYEEEDEDMQLHPDPTGWSITVREGEADE